MQGIVVVFRTSLSANSVPFKASCAHSRSPHATRSVVLRDGYEHSGGEASPYGNHLDHLLLRPRRSLSGGSPDILEYIPSIYRAPTIYSMSREEIAAIVDETVSELPIMGLCHAQAHDSYIKVCFDKTTRALMPHLTIDTLCGDKGPPFSPAAHWNMQDDDENLGKGSINFTMIPGANHFVSFVSWVLICSWY